MKNTDLLKPALIAVWEASRCCEAIASELLDSDSQTKSDRSPVTIADYASQALILHRLKSLTPDVGIVAEEGAEDLRNEPELISRIASFTQRFCPEVNADTLLDLLDCGNHPGGNGTFWTLDPIDGTKGFLRGGQYAVALALIEKGQPTLGILGCPRYQWIEGVTGVVFSGGEGIPGQFWTSESSAPRRLQTSSKLNSTDSKLCESVESAHTAHNLSELVIKDLGISSDVLRMDSQAKYAAVASGAAGLYLRLPVKKGYREKIWDHAAGLAVIEAAGGRVTDLNGKALDFSQGETLKNNRGVIASNGTLHHPALAALLVHMPEKPNS
ncbi:3'(2'),5'-bisphosphate nucleotidase [Kiritimatiellota bacterium B12222]|nr:3'(2'),5'-bisphosphate nucleotidase [Kiritimatiellota bacterium B12222]